MDTPRLLGLTSLLIIATGALAAVPDTNADVNGDGRIDGADLVLMRTLFFSADAHADLDRDGRVNFADLALLKAALGGGAPGAIGVPPPAPSVYLEPETQSVTVGDPVSVNIWWDFTGEAALGGGTDFTWDPAAFALVSIVFDDNFGTGPGQFDPAFTRCDDEPCSAPGVIDGLATGNFTGLGDPGPIYIATLTFNTLRTGAFSIAAAEDDGVIAGPFVSAITFLPYPDLQFAGADVTIEPGPPEPRIDIVPPVVAFPPTLIGETSSVQVRVNSIGELPLTISDVSPPQPPFALSADGCTGQVLPPTEGCDLTVDFTPTAPGAAASSIAITSDDPDRPEAEVTMSGTGFVLPTPDISVRPFVGFTSVRVGQTAHSVVSVENRGAGPLQIGQIGVTNPIEAPFAIAFDACSNQTLLPGRTCPLVLSFAPTDAGLATGDLDIPSNDPDTPSLVVQARATAEPRIALSGGGIQADAGRCTNRATGQAVVAALGGGTTLPCEGVGLTADAGDALAVVMHGTADSASVLSGRGLGMTVDHVRCANETTGQAVQVNPPGPGTAWNCIAWGLTVTPGDTVSMSVFGEAL